MSFFQTLEDDGKALVNKLENFCVVDAWPYLREFFSLLIHQEGSVALRAAIGALPEIIVGDEAAAGAEVIAAVAGSLAANMKADTATVLQDVSTAINTDPTVAALAAAAVTQIDASQAEALKQTLKGSE